MKVFSVVNGMVFEGATMHEATLASGVKIPAIEVGSDVPKKKGILPIIDGKPEEKVFHVKLECSSPRFAKVRMIEEDDGDRTGALVVLRTTCGKGGSASHNGDYLGWTCGGIHPECENSIPYRTENPNLPIFQNEDFLKDCPMCGAKLFPLWGKFVSTFKIMVAGQSNWGELSIYRCTPNRKDYPICVFRKPSWSSVPTYFVVRERRS